MLEALRHSLNDPIRYALPFFLLTIVIELVTLAVLVRLQFHEYGAVLRDIRGAKRWRHRLGYVFGPPGWQPTLVDWSERQTPAMVGAGLTSETL